MLVCPLLFFVCATLVFGLSSPLSHVALYHSIFFLRLPSRFLLYILVHPRLFPFYDLFLPLSSPAQRTCTVCIMYCTQPRKDMMNSNQIRGDLYRWSWRIHKKYAIGWLTYRWSRLGEWWCIPFHHYNCQPTKPLLSWAPPYVHPGKDSRVLPRCCSPAGLMGFSVLVDHLSTYAGLRVSPLAKLFPPWPDVMMPGSTIRRRVATLPKVRKTAGSLVTCRAYGWMPHALGRSSIMYSH